MRPGTSLLLAVLPAACSLTTSLNGLSTSEPGGGDGGGAPAAADASVDSDASTPCSGLSATTIFCTDFPEVPLNQIWDERPLDRGLVDTDQAAFVSPPRSLLASTEPVTTSGNSPRAFVAKRFSALAGRPMRYTFRLAMSVEQAAPGNDAVLASLRLEGTTADHSLQVVGKGGTTAGTFTVALIEQDAANDTVTSAQLTSWPAAGQWAHVEVEMTLRDPSGGGNEWRAVVDGTSTATKPFTASVSNGVPALRVGVSWARTPAAAWRVRYDDASLEAVPLS